MNLQLGIPRHEPLGAFRPSRPVSADAGQWTMGRALRHAIGWFDYDALNDPSEFPAGDMDVEGFGAQAPLSEAADLMRRLAVVLQPPLTRIETPNGVLEWTAPLLPYQRQGVLTLVSRPSLLLADSMGLGKTVQAIAALRILYQQEQIESALVVCPTSLILQWQRELMQWSPEFKVVAVMGSPTQRGTLWQIPAHVKLVGYETMRADVLETQNSPALRQTWGVVVLDEASRIKNRQSAIAVACKRLKAARRWALTGTPLENRLDDVVSLLEFLLQPEQAEPSQSPTVPEIKMLLHANLLRRRKEDVLTELPPKRIHEIVLELPPAQRAAYERAEQEGIVQLTASAGALTVVHVLELIARLKQLCNADPVSSESGKLADIAERMETLTAEGQRALIFSQFVDAQFGVKLAANVLHQFAPLTLTGSQSPAQRAEVIKKFTQTTHHKALILSLRAGGQGLNLQAASYVFHLDRWWNPALEEQADARAHRLGQQSPVTIYRYICAGTIEERIAAKLQSKREMFQTVVEDDRMDIASKLTEAELFDLFGLSARRSFRG